MGPSIKRKVEELPKHQNAYDELQSNENENSFTLRPSQRSSFIPRTRSRTLQNEKRDIQHVADGSRLTPREIRNITLSKKASSDSDIEESE